MQFKTEYGRGLMPLLTFVCLALPLILDTLFPGAGSKQSSYSDKTDFSSAVTSACDSLDTWVEMWVACLYLYINLESEVHNDITQTYPVGVLIIFHCDGKSWLQRNKNTIFSLFIQECKHELHVEKHMQTESRQE